MANRANIERIKKDIYPITCADIRRYLEDDVLGFKLHGLDVRKWNSPNGVGSYAVIRISIHSKNILLNQNPKSAVDKLLAQESMFREYDKDVLNLLKPFMFPKNIAQAKQSYEVLAQLWERGIDMRALDAIIKFTEINPVEGYPYHIGFLRPEKIIEQMLEDPATGKIDGDFCIPYSNVFGHDENDFMWFPVISHEGETRQPVSLDVLYNL